MVNSCIPSAYFVVGSQSITCARRRRQAAIDLLELKDDEEESINPSNIVEVVPTAAPKLTDSEQNNKEMAVVSSKNDAEITEEVHRQRRNFLFNYVVTLTQTSVTTVYNATVIKKTLNLLATPAASFVCIPSGYIICWIPFF